MTGAPQRGAAHMRRTSIFLKEKSWRKAEFISAAQVKENGVPKRPAVWGDSAQLEEFRSSYWTDDEN